MARETNRKDVNTEQYNPSTPSSSKETGTRTSPAAPRGERERGISTGREEGGRAATASSMTRSGGTNLSPAPIALGHPLMLMQRMADDMDRLFERFGFGRTGFGLTPTSSLGDLSWGSGAGSLAGAERTLWSPTVEVFERGNNIVVRADLPGVKKEDLQVETEDEVLTISGERRDEQEEKREGFYRSERSYGRFYRAIPLPEGVNTDQIAANFKDGVLEVTLPAPQERPSSARRIEIR